MSALLTELRNEINRLNELVGKLIFYGAELNQQGRTSEEFDLSDANGRLRDRLREATGLAADLSVTESRLAQEDNDRDSVAQELYEKYARNHLKALKRLENAALAVYNKIKTGKEEEKPKPKKTPKPKPPVFSDIPKRIDEAVTKFNKNIPSLQRGMFDALMEEVAKLDLQPNGNIKASVANIKRIAAIKNKLNRLILTDEYKAEVKDFARAFNDITRLQNDYWKTVEKTFKPRPLLKAVRELAIRTTIQALTEDGFNGNVIPKITDVLQRNITTGGSVKDLMGSLRDQMLNTETPGVLDQYVKTITTTSLNTYSAEVTNIISSDLGYEWFLFSNSTIKTSREMCLSMRRPENRYFHVSMIPSLLRAEGLVFTDPVDGEEKPVRINPKTKLPFGFIPNTTPENFPIVRCGFNCGHQLRPVSEGLVPNDIKEKIMQRPDYIRWMRINKAA